MTSIGELSDAPLKSELFGRLLVFRFMWVGKEHQTMKPDLWCGCSSSQKESKQNLQVCFLPPLPKVEVVEGQL